MNANPFAWIEPPVDAMASRLADATDAGVPLDELFLALADDSDNRHVRRVSRALAERLAAGDDLPTAVAATASVLPPSFRRALAAATDASQTAPLLRGMAVHEAARHRLKLQLGTAIFYPVLILSLLAMIVFALCLTIVPEFREIFLDFDLELPVVTTVVFELANLAPSIVGVVVLLVVLTTALGRVPVIGRIIHWLRTGIPFAGQLWIWSAQHDFASMLAELVGSRLPLDDALRCTSESLRDQNLARAARIVARKCEQGIALSQGLAESMHFDRAVTGLAAWGEANDALAAALRQAAQHYEHEIDQHVTFLSRVAPPILYVGVLSTVLLFVFAMFVPLIDMTNGLWY
jgi:type IV pilus assembly protein PilC